MPYSCFCDENFCSGSCGEGISQLLRQNPHSALVPFLKYEKARITRKDPKPPLSGLQRSSLQWASSGEKGLLGVRQQAERTMLPLLGSTADHSVCSLLEDRHASRAIIDVLRTPQSLD